MRDEYAKAVAYVCGDNWDSSDTPLDEQDGGYGMAMVLACINGCRPSLGDFSAFLRVPTHVLDTAYKRLQTNGVFAASSPVMNDPLLCQRFYDWGNNEAEHLKAWCHVAGLASAFVGKGHARSQTTGSRAA